jgi:hypothetical protein
MRYGVLIFIMLLCSLPAHAQDSQPSAVRESKAKTKSAASAVVAPPEKTRPVIIPRFDKSPAIDGKLDDDIWKTAVVLKDFYQTAPGDNIAPSKQTEVMMGFDSKFLYMAFRAYDDPSKVRATVATRDNVLTKTMSESFSTLSTISARPMSWPSTRSASSRMA